MFFVLLREYEFSLKPLNWIEPWGCKKTAKASKREWDIAQETHISNQQNLPLAPETLRENDKEETRVREAIREAINVNRKQENDREESETNCLTQKD